MWKNYSFQVRFVIEIMLHLPPHFGALFFYAKKQKNKFIIL